ncbi:MAG: ion transporter [Minisyncoccia bacterium]
MPRALHTFLKAAFQNPQSTEFAFVNNGLALATIISIVTLVLETVHSLSAYVPLFHTIEYTTVGLFTMEYMARVAMAPSKWRYIFSFFGLVDLLSIIPSYLALGNATFLKAARTLRILRFLRMLRLVKLARFEKLHRKTKNKTSLYALNIEIYAVALISVLLILGVGIYVFEAGHRYASDIPSAMFWVFKVILGGIPIEQPTTTVGLAILIATRFASLVLFGLLVGIIGTMARKALTGSDTD